MLGGLAAAQIDADLRFHCAIYRLSKIIAQENVFRRNRCIGLKLVNPVAIGSLLGKQRGRRLLDGHVEQVT